MCSPFNPFSFEVIDCIEVRSYIDNEQMAGRNNVPTIRFSGLDFIGLAPDFVCRTVATARSLL